MAGTRANAVVNIPTVLLLQFLKNGEPFDAYAIDRVEIYDSYAKAQTGNPGDVLQTILSADIQHIATGLYRYIADAQSVSKTYFDKMILTPEVGQSPWNKILQFFVKEATYTAIDPDAIFRCLVWGMQETNEDGSRDTITVQLETDSVRYKENTIIRNEPIEITPDANGYWQVEIIETANMIGTPKYVWRIGSAKYTSNVADAVQCAFNSLPNLVKVS